MKRKGGLLLVLVLSTPLAWACFNIEFSPSFVLGKTPTWPIRPYLEGDLGVVQGHFLHEYLFVAFRHLSGLGFTKTEIRAFDPDSLGSNTGGDHSTPLEKWIASLQEIRPGSEPGYRWRYGYRLIPGAEWQSYVNCPDDSFRTAAETLRERTERFGSHSREVAAWLDGQETVFDNCSEGESIPPPLPVGFDPLVRADREYQIASALFYSNHWDEAAARFEAIARDVNSPWAKWGRYLAARCQLRKGTLGAGPDTIDRAALEDAARRFKEVLGDPALAHVHASSQGLLDHIAAFLQPEARMEELAPRLVSAEENSRIGQDWRDFDYFLDRGHGRDMDNDLITWIKVMRGEGDARKTALGRWRETRSVRWLLAALSLSSGDQPDTDALLQAAAQVPRGDPGYRTVAYHRFRLLLERGASDLARAGLDEILDDPNLDALNPSRNPFLALRLPLSQNLDEFLRFAPRTPVEFGFRGASPVHEPYLDETSTRVFNRSLPLETLGRIVQTDDLPEGIRRELALAVWVRSHLIAERSTAETLTPTIARMWPELATDLKEMRREADPVSRRFRLTWILLRHPGLQPYLRAALHRASPLGEIDSLRENWWCQISPSQSMQQAVYLRFREIKYGSPLEPPSSLEAPIDLPFLTDTQRKQAQGELARLFEVPTAPNFLCQETLRWAEARPDDPKLPEALHLAVRSTRFGCADRKTTALSRRCFQLLHRRFPKSKWTKATKYWY